MPEDIKAWFEQKQPTLIDFKLSVLQSTNSVQDGSTILREIMEHEQSIVDGSYVSSFDEEL